MKKNDSTASFDAKIKTMSMTLHRNIESRINTITSDPKFTENLQKIVFIESALDPNKYSSSEKNINPETGLETSVKKDFLMTESFNTPVTENGPSRYKIKLGKIEEGINMLTDQKQIQKYKDKLDEHKNEYNNLEINKLLLSQHLNALENDINFTLHNLTIECIKENFTKDDLKKYELYKDCKALSQKAKDLALGKENHNDSEEKKKKENPADTLKSIADNFHTVQEKMNKLDFPKQHKSIKTRMAKVNQNLDASNLQYSKPTKIGPNVFLNEQISSISSKVQFEIDKIELNPKNKFNKIIEKNIEKYFKKLDDSNLIKRDKTPISKIKSYFYDTKSLIIKNGTTFKVNIYDDFAQKFNANTPDEYIQKLKDELSKINAIPRQAYTKTYKDVNDKNIILKEKIDGKKQYENEKNNFMTKVKKELEAVKHYCQEKYISGILSLDNKARYDALKEVQQNMKQHEKELNSYIPHELENRLKNEPKNIKIKYEQEESERIAKNILNDLEKFEANKNAPKNLKTAIKLIISKIANIAKGGKFFKSIFAKQRTQIPIIKEISHNEPEKLKAEQVKIVEKTAKQESEKSTVQKNEPLKIDLTDRPLHKPNKKPKV